MPAELARQWRQAATALIDAAIPEDTELLGNWLVCAALLPHAQAVLAEDRAGMARIANYLGSSAVTPQPEISSAECLTHRRGSSARSTRMS
jgi:hypothetical protein